MYTCYHLTPTWASHDPTVDCTVEHSHSSTTNAVCSLLQKALPLSPQDPTQPSPSLGLLKRLPRALYSDLYLTLKLKVSEPLPTPQVLRVKPAALVIFLDLSPTTMPSIPTIWTKGLCARHCAQCLIYVNSFHHKMIYYEQCNHSNLVRNILFPFHRHERGGVQSISLPKYILPIGSHQNTLWA